MSLYLIAGILLDFNYLYPTFFENNIEKYEVYGSMQEDFKMRTIICDKIETPEGAPNITYKNRSIYHKQNETVIIVKDQQGMAIEMITHTLDYKEIEIKLVHMDEERLAELEYVLTGMLFLELAILKNRLPIHGSAFMVQKEAVIIAASSGTGKTTHAKHWASCISPFTMINDDKPLIHMIDHRFYVSGTPWSGKTKSNNNITVPLKTIVFYHQGDSNLIKELSVDEKLNELMHHALRPRGEKLLYRALEMMDDLIRHADMVSYDAINHISAVYPIYQRIYGGSL